MSRPAPAAADRDRPRLVELFYVFARISALSIGGGYVMFPVLKREAVDARAWLSAHELIDFYALGQSVPGIIAMNTAVLIGYRKRGLSGAAAAALGMALPPMAVIMLIAAFLTPFFDTPWAQKAFAGVRTAVVAMVGMAVWEVGRKSVNSLIKGLLAGASFLALAVFHCSPILLMIAGGIFGWLFFRREGGA